MKTILSTSVFCLIIAAGALAWGQAQGATIERNVISHAAGMCQGALPAFETAIRKRPLAVQNEGDATAFVTCSFASRGALSPDSSNPSRVTVYFNKSPTADANANLGISCTGVSGFQTSSNQYIVKSAVLPASAFAGGLTWFASDFAGAPATFPSGLFSISCALAPDVGIIDLSVRFREEIGSP